MTKTIFVSGCDAEEVSQEITREICSNLEESGLLVYLSVLDEPIVQAIKCIYNLPQGIRTLLRIQNVIQEPLFQSTITQITKAIVRSLEEHHRVEQFTAAAFAKRTRENSSSIHIIPNPKSLDEMFAASQYIAPGNCLHVRSFASNGATVPQPISNSESIGIDSVDFTRSDIGTRVVFYLISKWKDIPWRQPKSGS